MDKALKGQCLCGKVQYQLADDFRTFYLCHCQQCRQLTGSAFAANLFTAQDNIDWTAGEDKVVKYEHSERSFSKSFCGCCGSALPFVTQSGTALIVPAGSLLDEPSIAPKANIFTEEKACWLDEGLQAQAFAGFPQK